MRCCGVGAGPRSVSEVEFCYLHGLGHVVTVQVLLKLSSECL